MKARKVEDKGETEHSRTPGGSVRGPRERGVIETRSVGGWW